MKDIADLKVPTDWSKAWLPAILGGGALMAALYGYGGFAGLFGKKDRKMTKLEKACLGFVAALCEKVEELEKQKNDLSKRLTEISTDYSTEKTRADQAEKLADERSDQLSKAKIQIEELKLSLEAAAAKPSKAKR